MPEGQGNARPFVVVGRVLKPWGMRGALRVAVLTDFPQRFAQGSRFYIRGVVYECHWVRRERSTVILKLVGVDTQEQAEALRGQELEIPDSSLMPLPLGTYYVFQLVGLEVYTTQGEALGRVVEVLQTGSNDVYVVRGQGSDLLIPATQEVVKEVDLLGQRMVVELLPGLR
ncbi:MAG: 16S rRNA processing protein RimM [Chloroflexi bacterium]|nr:16S rRNA processing protein RimM [Chloroflexota bacterium]